MEGSSLKDEVGSVFSDTAGGGVILTLWWVSVGEYIWSVCVQKCISLEEPHTLFGCPVPDS